MYLILEFVFGKSHSQRELRVLPNPRIQSTMSISDQMAPPEPPPVPELGDAETFDPAPAPCRSSCPRARLPLAPLLLPRVNALFLRVPPIACLCLTGALPADPPGGPTAAGSWSLTLPEEAPLSSDG